MSSRKISTQKRATYFSHLYLVASVAQPKFEIVQAPDDDAPISSVNPVIVVQESDEIATLEIGKRLIAESMWTDADFDQRRTWIRNAGVEDRRTVDKLRKRKSLPVEISDSAWLGVMGL